MKIDISRKPSETKLSELKNGETFFFEDELYTKTDEKTSFNGEIRCVRLQSGTLQSINPNKVVERVKTKVVIDE